MTFKDKYGMECTFLEEGVAFCNSLRHIYYPYGSLDSLSLSFLGVMQAVSRGQVSCFTVDRKDKAEIRELVRKARETMKTAPAGSALVVDMTGKKEADLVDPSLPREEQLKLYKGQFVRGIISREEYDLRKILLAD